MLMTSGFPDGPQIHHLPNLAQSERHRQHGKGRIEPLTPVVAGVHTTVEFHFDLGQTPIAPNGQLSVVWLWPYDWAQLQTEDANGDGYMTVSCSRPEVELKPIYSFRGPLIPWNHQIVIEIVTGTLQPGDKVRLVCGCRDGGGGGWRARSHGGPP